MKRVLIVLAALLLPLSVMAMTPVSDNDLSGITGQAGVTIGVSQLHITLKLDTVTWGDVDGLYNGTNNVGYEAAGFINMEIADVPMHINIAAMTLTIDVGSDLAGTGFNGNTAVVIGISNFNMSMDAFEMSGIYLDATNGVLTDYMGGYSADYWNPTRTYEATVEGGQSAKSLGLFGFSGLEVGIPSATITIEAH